MWYIADNRITVKKNSGIPHATHFTVFFNNRCTFVEKPKRRKSLLNGDVFLGYVHPKPEQDRKSNGHLNQVDTSAYINWKAVCLYLHELQY